MFGRFFVKLPSEEALGWKDRKEERSLFQCLTIDSSNFSISSVDVVGRDVRRFIDVRLDTLKICLP